MRTLKKFTFGLISLFKRLGKVFRLGAIGVIFAGILTAIQGCTLEDFLKFLFVLWALGLPQGQASTKVSSDLQFFDTAKILDSQSEQSLVSISPDGRTLTFANPTPQINGIQPGDSVVIGITNQTPFGYLGKVTNVSNSGGMKTIQTTDASLADIIKEGKLSFNATLTSSGFQANTGLATPNTAAFSPENTSLSFNADQVIFDNDGDPTTKNDQIRISGTFSLGVDTSLDAEWSFDDPLLSLAGIPSSLKRARFTGTFTLSGDITVSAKATHSFLDKQFVLSNPVPLTAIPIGPIVIVPTILLQAVVNGQFRAGISGSLSKQSSFTSGFEFDGTNLTAIRDFSDLSNPVTLEVNPSAGLNVSVTVGPKLSLLVYGVAGPKVEAGGFLELDVDFLRDHLWELSGGLKANIGGELSVLGYELLKVNVGAGIQHKVRLLPIFPNAPSNLTVSTAGTTALNLSWNDNSTNEHGFKIERKLSSAGTFSEIDTVSSGLNSYQDTNLSSSTSYSYRVRSFNNTLGAVGHSNYSNTASAATSSLPTYTLSIGRSGSGTVTSSPPGIQCGSDCSELYNQSTVVTLTASPTTGSNFAGWSGDADCTDGQVTMNTNKSCTATFNQQSPTVPILQVQPLSLNFNAQEGSNPPSQTFNISNGNGGTMNWIISQNIGWVTLSPSSGSGDATITANVNSSGLAANTYSGIITVSAEGASNSPLNIPVTLTVSNNTPILQVTPNSQTFSTQAGTNPQPQSLSITNGGGGTLSWSISKDQDWLTITPSSGSGSATVTVSVNTSGLAPGQNTAIITVTANGAQGSPKNIGVLLNISTDQVPAAPSSLVATAGSSTTINLSWVDNSNNEDNFRICKRQRPNDYTVDSCFSHPLDKPNLISYTDGTQVALTPSTKYCYKVAAFNNLGDSPFSTEACATTDSIGQSHPWAMYQRDARHTGKSTSTGPQSPSDPIPLGPDVEFNGSPAIDSDGIVYIGADDGKLYAFPSPSLNWPFTPESATIASGFQMRVTPAIGGDGTIYTVIKETNESALYAINPNGTQKWRTEFRNTVDNSQQASPVIDKDGIIYVVAAGDVYAISQDGGTILAQENNIGSNSTSTVSTPALFFDVLEGKTRAYVVASDKLYCFIINLDTSKFDNCPGWPGGIFIDSGKKLATPSIGSEGTIYIQSLDNLYAYSPLMLLEWMEPSLGVGSDLKRHLSPAVDDARNTIYIVNSDSLKAVDMDGSGEIAWTSTSIPANNSNPIIDNSGTIFVADSTSNNLRAVNPNDGSEIWAKSVDTNTSSPAIDGFGNIYIGANGSLAKITE